ncbi:MAG TPA: NAD-dependent epimerase/dehydratase family protein, partial [Tepidanaerobacter syntrophicus]|uniref:GDP-mannose 4,6-dehydratase n=2 Tax=Bacteria TaxID=2 RepID=UPI00175985CF
MGHHSILVTGCAGFIGFHLSMRLLKDGYQVVGLDNLNDYYDVSLKQSRLSLLEKDAGFRFVYASLEDKK